MGLEGLTFIVETFTVKLPVLLHPLALVTVKE
jgi:hypothetical protein